MCTSPQQQEFFNAKENVSANEKLPLSKVRGGWICALFLAQQ